MDTNTKQYEYKVVLEKDGKRYECGFASVYERTNEYITNVYAEPNVKVISITRK